MIWKKNQQHIKNRWPGNGLTELETKLIKILKVNIQGPEFQKKFLNLKEDFQGVEPMHEQSFCEKKR